LVEMVTGRPPRRGEPWRGLPLPPGLPPELAGLLSRLLAERPADRYPHAAALLADLGPWEDRRGVRPAPRRPPWHDPPPSPSRPARPALRGRARGARPAAPPCGRRAPPRAPPPPAPRPAPPPARPPSLAPPPVIASAISQVTDFPGRTTSPSLSPDGGTVVYVR